ncbi:MAG: cyclic nucleotide-binding domain-containing protein [Pseudomonadota bacterium]
MERSEIQRALEGSEFFKGLEKPDIEKIAGLCEVKTFEPGQTIFRQGDFGDRIYIIVEGLVFLERARDLGNRKGSVVIGMLGKGRVLGCWSTLLDEPHNLMSSAPCQKETKVIALEGARLRALMVSNRLLGFNVLERLCFLLRDRIQGAYGAMERL